MLQPLTFVQIGNSFLVGMDLDFTNTHSTPDPGNADRTPFAPSPILLLLIDEGSPEKKNRNLRLNFFILSGKIVAYVLVKTDLPKDETLKLPFMRQASNVPVTQALQPFSERADLVPKSALSQSQTGMMLSLNMPTLMHHFNGVASSIVYSGATIAFCWA